MIAVIYHSTAPGKDHDLYRELFRGFRDNWKMPLVHLTTEDHPIWGDIGYRYPLNPKHIVLNRELSFFNFLKENAGDSRFCFTEPDARLSGPIEEIKEDCALIYRPKDRVPMCPAFRIATRAALPLFSRFVDAMRSKNKEWDGDSDAFTEIWHDMGSPTSNTTYKGVTIKMLPYSRYVCRHSEGPCGNWKAQSKLQLVT